MEYNNILLRLTVNDDSLKREETIIQTRLEDRPSMNKLLGILWFYKDFEMKKENKIENEYDLDIEVYKQCKKLMINSNIGETFDCYICSNEYVKFIVINDMLTSVEFNVNKVGINISIVDSKLNVFMSNIDFRNYIKKYNFKPNNNWESLIICSEYYGFYYKQNDLVKITFER